jgi:hypothetical protein
MREVIMLRVEAPAKPAEGQACNGCGVCCALEPCPIGQVISGRRSGACSALAWSETAQRYVCGLVSDPRARLPRALGWAAPLVSRWARRLIAAGIGCDAGGIASERSQDSPERRPPEARQAPQGPTQ